ncbi:response regulator [Aerosakkonemataceae cyanobacterium BLCC-F154]|uniref:Response regulator n=1 Tax=Floridaenema fluviatile BLCC-F154 TaxID=3153640 RepID=A0ABV4YJM9_9CYAN
MVTKTKRILIVDREPYHQKIVQTCLKTMAGWDVILAASSSEGLRMAELEQPDAILLEARMPQINGVAFLKILRSNPATKSIPVIFLTIEPSLTERAKFLQVGAVGAIAKPFDPITLVTKITETLGWTRED